MITRAKIINKIFENHASMSSFISYVRENEYLHCTHCGERKDRFDIENEFTVECNSCGNELSIEFLLEHDRDDRNKDTIIGYLKSRTFDHDEDDFRRAYRNAENQLKGEEEQRQAKQEEERQAKIREEQRKRNERKVLTEQKQSDIIKVTNQTKQIKNEKGEVIMTTTNNTNGNLFGGFNMGAMMGEMGAINDGRFKFSMLGVAIKDANGGYVCYNKENGALTDTMGMTFDMPDMFLAMPTGAIKEGDLILNNGKPLYVVAKLDENRVNCINPVDGLEQIVVLKKSPFGFNFHTKVFSMMEMFGGGEGIKNGEFSPMMFMLPMMMGQQGQEGQQNPMQGMMQMLPMMMMFGGNKGENPFGQMFNMGQNQEKKEEIKTSNSIADKIAEIKQAIAKKEEEKKQKQELKELEEKFANMEKEEE